jgi:hypothetical protein
LKLCTGLSPELVDSGMQGKYFPIRCGDRAAR